MIRTEGGNNDLESSMETKNPSSGGGGDRAVAGTGRSKDTGGYGRR